MAPATAGDQVPALGDPHTTQAPDPATVAVRLVDFLAEFLGDWPATGGLTVVGSRARTQPGWDGEVRDVVGVLRPDGGVLSVPPDQAQDVRQHVTSAGELLTRLPGALGRPHARVYAGRFRWTEQPTDLPDAGEWVPADDPRVPDWLRPFGGTALVAFADGGYAAGVGVKRHNPHGMEISVGTEEGHRGKGFAARLVAQAARAIIAAGAVPIYLHDPANIASDRTAARAGFPDLGWKIVGVAG